MIDGLGERDGEEVAGAPLEHGDTLDFVDHVGQQGNGCGTAADDDDLFVCVVEVLRPELRMHDGAFEVLDARNLALQGRLVVVVACS